MSKKSLFIHEVREDWKNIVKKLTDSAKEVLGDAEVIPFGSFIEGKAVAASDLDVLIVTKDLPKSAWSRARIIGKIEEETGLPPLHPIQIHLTTWEEAQTNPIYKEVLAKHLKNKP